MLVAINGRNSNTEDLGPLFMDLSRGSEQTKASEDMQLLTALSDCVCKYGNIETKSSRKGNPARYTFSNESMIT
jgi:hypothetical protein